MNGRSKNCEWTIEFIGPDGLSFGEIKSNRTFGEIIRSYLIYSQKQKEDGKGQKID